MKAVKGDGLRVEIGRPMSTDGGVVMVARHIRSSGWFKALVTQAHQAIIKLEGERFGFAQEEKLQRSLLALVAGLAMGYRNGNEIATVIAGDRLWREVLGKRVTQPDISRLVDLMSRVGIDPLRAALLASAGDGVLELNLDGDSSVLELHGRQEGGAYNVHYHEFGYHAGWMIDTRTSRFAALWLMEGDASTQEGQVTHLERILASGRKVASYRGDAGMPHPELMAALEKGKTLYTIRLKRNPVLERMGEAICPPGPWPSGAVSFGEFPYQAKSWPIERRVAVKFQTPEGEGDAPCLFLETFFFVTSRTEAPEQVVGHYFLRGEAERIFGEFVQAFEPTFRHPDMSKNEAWLQLLGLAANTLSTLRHRIVRETSTRRIPSLKPLLDEPGWVSALFKTYVTTPVRPTLARFRAFALKLASVLVEHAGRMRIRLHPTHLKPAWPQRLLLA
jgi:hypothetical protein